MKVKCINVSVVDYSDCFKSAVFGIRDMLQIASKHSSVTFDVDIIAAHSLKPREIDYLILPPSLQQIDPTTQPWVSKYVKTSHEKGATICSICAGIFFVLSTDVIAGRAITTHWAFADALRKQEGLIINTDELVIEYADLITAGGLISWIDLCLQIIRRECGMETVTKVAQHFVVDIGRHSQLPYKRFTPDFRHGDTRIIKAQHFMGREISKQCSNDKIAAHVNMSVRTFIRRFNHANGMSPQKYLRLLKMEHAKRLFATTKAKVGEVCHHVGYDDLSSFIRAFESIAGDTPSAFRKRFSTPRIASNIE